MNRISSNFLIDMAKSPIVLTGHYGSGKSELAVNLAVRLARSAGDTVVMDLDIANPYFRSREMAGVLRARGVKLVSNAYGFDITQDLPAVSPQVKSFLGNVHYKRIVDVGGNSSGARVLNQFSDTLIESEAKILAVVNVYRPETDDAEKIITMIESIETEIGRKVDGILNNANMLRETEPIHVLNGLRILMEVSEKTGIPVVANCAEKEVCKRLPKSCRPSLPIYLYMRPAWLDCC